MLICWPAVKNIQPIRALGRHFLSFLCKPGVRIYHLPSNLSCSMNAPLKSSDALLKQNKKAQTGKSCTKYITLPLTALFTHTNRLSPITVVTQWCLLKLTSDTQKLCRSYFQPQQWHCSSALAVSLLPKLVSMSFCPWHAPFNENPGLPCYQDVSSENGTWLSPTSK